MMLHLESHLGNYFRTKKELINFCELKGKAFCGDNIPSYIYIIDVKDDIITAQYFNVNKVEKLSLSVKEFIELFPELEQVYLDEAIEFSLGNYGYFWDCKEKRFFYVMELSEKDLILLERYMDADVDDTKYEASIHKGSIVSSDLKSVSIIENGRLLEFDFKELLYLKRLDNNYLG